MDQDWHVDFAASSVYYTIHTGSKVRQLNDLTRYSPIRCSMSSGLPSRISKRTQNVREEALEDIADPIGSGSADLQQGTWLGDMCDEVRKVTLVAGDTMWGPRNMGLIKADGRQDYPFRIYSCSRMSAASFFYSTDKQYTPVDTIVFGGNFLHSYNIDTREPRRWTADLTEQNSDCGRLRSTPKCPSVFAFPSSIGEWMQSCLG